MFWSLSTACYSKYCQFVVLGRGLSVKIQSPKKTCTSLKICECEYCAHLYHWSGIFLCLKFYKPLYSLLLLESVHFFASTWKRPVHDKYRVPKCLEQQEIPHAWFTRIRVKKIPVHMKSQTLNKNKTKKFFSNNLKHNWFKICSCPTLKVLRWIGL